MTTYGTDPTTYVLRDKATGRTRWATVDEVRGAGIDPLGLIEEPDDVRGDDTDAVLADIVGPPMEVRGDEPIDRQPLRIPWPLIGWLAAALGVVSLALLACWMAYVRGV